MSEGDDSGPHQTMSPPRDSKTWLSYIYFINPASGPVESKQTMLKSGGGGGGGGGELGLTVTQHVL